MLSPTFSFFYLRIYSIFEFPLTYVNTEKTAEILVNPVFFALCSGKVIQFCSINKQLFTNWKQCRGRRISKKGKGIPKRGW